MFWMNHASILKCLNIGILIGRILPFIVLCIFAAIFRWADREVARRQAKRQFSDIEKAAATIRATFHSFMNAKVGDPGIDINQLATALQSAIVQVQSLLRILAEENQAARWSLPWRKVQCRRRRRHIWVNTKAVLGSVQDIGEC